MRRCPARRRGWEDGADGRRTAQGHGAALLACEGNNELGETVAEVEFTGAEPSGEPAAAARADRLPPPEPLQQRPAKSEAGIERAAETWRGEINENKPKPKQKEKNQCAGKNEYASRCCKRAQVSRPATGA